jgi:ATP-dependent RNA/DNA helicase IGHMBP2
MPSYCEHGNHPRTCAQCRTDAVSQAEQRAAANRARGESRSHAVGERPTLAYPWQKDAFEAWRDGGRTGLVALSPGLPAGDLPYAAIVDMVEMNQSNNVLVACTPSERDGIAAALRDRFGLEPSSLIDHHFLEPHEDGTLIVADLEELHTVDLQKWGRFASTGLLVLLDADAVGQQFGRVLLGTPFASRFCLSRQPSAMDLLVSRPWAPGFGPLVHRATETEARDLGVLPRMKYRLHVEMLRAEGKDEGPVGPWEPTDIPTRIPLVASTPFMRGKARDVAIARAGEDNDLWVIHSGVTVRAAKQQGPMAELPNSYESIPTGWLMADPALGVRDLLRVATVGFKTVGAAAPIEDVVVLPVPADVCRMPPWNERWSSAARQLDRVSIALLLADDPSASMMPEELEILVGVALALRGIPVDELHAISSIVEQACLIAMEGTKVTPEEVRHAARANGGLAAALLVAAEEGPGSLLRIAHPGFTPSVPHLPHPSLYDARRHAWRGRAFMALANAAVRGDVVTAWGRYAELRFIFPSSLMLETATAYCKRHKLAGPLDDAQLRPIEDRTKIATGDRNKALDVLKEWSDALGIAEEHEREFLAKMHERQPERERRREGVALTDMKVVNRSRDTLTLESTFGRLPSTNMSPGSEVALVPVKEREEIGRGLVSKLTSRTVTIEFPDGPPQRTPNRITVNLVFDAKVFEAYHSAVHGARQAMVATTHSDDGPDGLIRAALLGETAGTKQQQSIDSSDLTPSQKDAIDNVLQGGRVRLIHGPPGTGKTHTLVRLAIALTKAGHSVLVTSDSNAGVDNLVVGLQRNGALAVRVGHAANIRDKAADACRVDPMDAPAFVRWAADQGVVVATTNYGAYRYLDRPGSTNPIVFDYVIHDEAGQSTAPSSLAAVMRGRRLVLAGDPLQLPPTVVSMDAKDAGLDVTLFERIEELTGEGRTKLISTQFRMREEIVKFSNEQYYDGRIETAPVAAEQEILEGLPPAAFQHVTGKENPRAKSGSISNDWEVESICAVVDKLRGDLREKGWTVAVLTPYQAQREAIRRRLPDVDVSTVDGAQGREWDVVLYSSVRSNPRHRLGFVSDERRLNVAATRARRHFILVGDERTLRDNVGFAKLIDGLQKIRIRYPAPQALQPRDERGRRDGNRRTQGRQATPRSVQQEEQNQRGPRNRRGPAKPRPNAPTDSQPAPGDGDEPKRRRRRRRRGPKFDSDAVPADDSSESQSARSTKVQAADHDREAPKDLEAKSKRVAKPTVDSKPKVESKPASEPKAKPAPKPKPATGGRCSANTKSGEQCKNKAQPGGRTCKRHG